MAGDRGRERPGCGRIAHRYATRLHHSRPDDAEDGRLDFLDELRGRPDWQDPPVVVKTAKDLTDDDRNRLNGGVERIIQKSDRDGMLRQLTREISRCVKPRITRVA